MSLLNCIKNISLLLSCNQIRKDLKLIRIPLFMLTLMRSGYVYCVIFAIDRKFSYYFLVGEG